MYYTLIRVDRSGRANRNAGLLCDNHLLQASFHYVTVFGGQLLKIEDSVVCSGVLEDKASVNVATSRFNPSDWRVRWLRVVLWFDAWSFVLISLLLI